MDELIEIVAQQLDWPAEGLSEHSSPVDTANWDSLATLRIAMALEVMHGVAFSTDELLKFNSVGAIRALLEAKLECR